MITVVTSRSFLLCEAINHITLRAEPEAVGYSRRVIPYYVIGISFVQGTRSNNSSNQNQSRDDSFVEIKVVGEKVALSLFKEIVAQIREQLPDQAYLNEMIENILKGGKDIYDDASEAKVDRPRKAKSGSKGLLRKSRSRR